MGSIAMPGVGGSDTMLKTLLMSAFTLLSFCVGSGLTEVYTSTAHLEHVLRTEREVVNVLDQYLETAEANLERIRNYVKDYERIMSDDITQTVDNPLNAYQLMKRLAIDWHQVEDNMQHSDWFTILADIRQRRSTLHMPGESDLQGVAQALIRLKQTYRLNVTELVRGNLQGIKTQAHLTARDCLFLGRNTMHLGSAEHAIEWLEQAMILAMHEGDQTAGQEEIRPFLEEAIVKFDQTNQKKPDGPPYFPPKMAGSYDLGEQFLSDKSKQRPLRDMFDDGQNYDALCRGQRLRSPEYEAKLKCFYKTGPHPYLRLRRVRVEESHLDPPVYTFHDIIYDNEIELIQMLARPTLQRSTVVGTNGVWRQVSDTRTSKNTWIYDSTIQEQPILQRLQARIQAVTDLNAANDNEAEALQIANYGVGGHYIPHYDFLFQEKTEEEMVGVDPRDLSLGDRIATLMFYLSDVSRGGATVFPKMGAAVWPKKGSAAFWYNLKSNGRGDMMTLHGACPVLHGSKWVANKWIRERAQVFTRQCGLTEEDKKGSSAN